MDIELTAFDKAHRPMKGQLLVEPMIERHTKLKVGGDLKIIVDPDAGRVPTFVRARIVKIGKSCREPEFKPGVIVWLVPHAGTLLPVPEDHAERMVLPEKQVFGVEG
jgi:hypothetical protein